MLRIAARRLAMAVPTLLGVTIIIFLLMTVLPGDPAAAFISEDMSAAEISRLRNDLGLNDPLFVRYISWLGDAITGDLGYSPYRRREVTDLLSQAWMNTAVLAGFSAIFGLVVGVVLGFVAGANRGKVLDRVVSGVGLVGLSIPSFFVAVLMLIIFSAQLNWFPAGGVVYDQGLYVFISHLFMPMFAGSLVTIAITARVTRASIVQTYGADFVQTLSAKGLGQLAILQHVFKNAISPVLTTSGLQIGYLLGGSVLVEAIFRWPGMGMLVFNAISARDLLVVQGATLVIALTFVGINLFVDLVQATVDPRLRRAVA